MNKCQHVIGNRQRVGPTGNKCLMILVEKCLKCGILVPVQPATLTYIEWKWVKRYNRKIEKEYIMLGYLYELLCANCNQHIGWITDNAPRGSVYCDSCKELEENEEE